MTSTPPAGAEELASTSQPRTWRAGTLTYTAGGLAILCCWLLWGDFSWYLKERSVPATVQLLLKKFHASDTLAGALISSLPSALTILVVPFVGYRSDRHRGPWGRRIPFLLITTPIAVSAIVCLAFNQQIGGLVDRILGAHSPGANSCILVFFALSWTLFEAATVVSNSLYNGLINDVVPRELLGRFFGAFRALNLTAAIIFNYWIFGLAEAHYVSIFLMVGLFYGVGFTLMCLNVKEGQYPLVVPMDMGRKTSGFLQGLKTYFQESFGNSYYGIYFVTMALFSQAAIPVSLFSVFYAKDLHMDMAVFGKCMALTYLISFGLAYPLGILADRFHPLRVTLVIIVLYGMAALLGGLFIRDTWTFGLAWVVQGVLSGSMLTSTASMAQRLLPRAEFAQFFSAQEMIRSLTAILVGTLVGVFLDHMHHAYRDIFFISFGMSAAAVIMGLLLYRRFMALGGPRNYAAPEGVSICPSSAALPGDAPQ